MFQSDLPNLHILLVGGRPTSLQVLRTAFGLLGIKHVRVISESARAIEALRAHTFNAIFCDASAEAYKGMAFPIAARRAKGIVNPMTPLFIIYSQARRRQVERARDLGVTDVLTHPLSAATIARKLEAAIISPRPFIAASSFFGPDRRGQRETPYNGKERRTRVAKKRRVSLPEAPTGDLTYI